MIFKKFSLYIIKLIDKLILLGKGDRAISLVGSIEEIIIEEFLSEFFREAETLPPHSK